MSNGQTKALWYQGENIGMDQVVADKKNTIYCGSISKPVAVTSGVPQDTVHARSSNLPPVC